MLIHVFLLMRSPGERQNHKYTHFNIINIIWLPLCSSRSPGFSLPMAAAEEGRTDPVQELAPAANRNRDQKFQRSDAGNEPRRTRPAPRAQGSAAGLSPPLGPLSPPRWLGQHRLQTASRVSRPQRNQKPFSLLQHTVISLYPSTFHCRAKGKTGACIF